MIENESKDNGGTGAAKVHGTKRRPVGAVIKFVIPTAVSVGLCWVLFRGDSLGEMMSIIRNGCDFVWIGAMLVLLLLSNFFRAFRWGLQLEAVGIKVPMGALVLSIFGTYAVNLVFPRLGEVWRCGYVAHREGAQFGTVAGTVVADRLADLLTGILFLLATLVMGHGALLRFVSRYPDFYRRMEQLMSSPLTWLVVACLIAAPVIFLRHRSHNRAVVAVQRFCREMWTGFAGIARMRHKWWWLFWTLLLWGCYFFQMALAFQAFGFTREIFATDGYTAVLVCFTLSSIGMGVPSNGGIGPYQVALIFALGLYMAPDSGAEAARAFEMDSKAFANLVLGVTTLMTIVLGLITFGCIAFSKRRR